METRQPRGVYGGLFRVKYLHSQQGINDIGRGYAEDDGLKSQICVDMKGINTDYKRSWLLGQCKRQPESREVAERRLNPASRNLSTKICINQTANKSGQTNRFYMHPSLAQSRFTAIIINSWRLGNNSIIPQTPVRSITRRGRRSPLQSKHARGKIPLCRAKVKTLLIRTRFDSIHRLIRIRDERLLPSFSWRLKMTSAQPSVQNHTDTTN